MLNKAASLLVTSETCGYEYDVKNVQQSSEWRHSLKALTAIPAEDYNKCMENWIKSLG